MSREIMQDAAWALKDLIAVYPETACIETRISAGKVIAALEAELAKPEREWVGLTDGEIQYILDCGRGEFIAIQKAQQLLKDKNTT